MALPLSLIDFWKIRRHRMGLRTEVMPFHHIKAQVLTDMVMGKLPKQNLMILEPPRAGKTDLGIDTFVPWSLYYVPDGEFILSSYSATRSTASSVSIRQTLSSDWYNAMRTDVFGASVKMRGSVPDGQQDYFWTEQGGSVKAVGVGGGITGFGAGKLRPVWGGCIIIDDPIKPQEAENSETTRKACIDWFHGTLESRRNRVGDPSTPIILIMQRLHPNDLAGHLLSTERHKWNVVQLPVHNEAEEVIWPGRYDIRELMELKESRPDIYWSQYMQSPTDAMSTILKRKWWRYWQDIREVEKRINIKIVTCDSAFEEKNSSDWSVFQCWGLENISGMVLLDQERGKWDFPDLVANAKSFWLKHSTPQAANYKRTPATEFWVEKRASGSSLAQVLRRNKIPARDWLPDTTKISPDKVARAKQTAMNLSAGRFFVPDPRMPGFKWVETFLNECEAFSSDGSHVNDDQVDTFTEAALIWEARGGGRGPLPADYKLIGMERKAA